MADNWPWHKMDKSAIPLRDRNSCNNSALRSMHCVHPLSEQLDFPSQNTWQPLLVDHHMNYCWLITTDHNWSWLIMTGAMDHMTSAMDHITSAMDHMTSAMDHMTSAMDHMTSAMDHTTSVMYHMTSVMDHMTSVMDHMTSVMDHMTQTLIWITADWSQLITGQSHDWPMTDTTDRVTRTRSSGGPSSASSGDCSSPILLRSQMWSRRSVPLDARMVSLWGDHWTYVWEWGRVRGRGRGEGGEREGGERVKQHIRRRAERENKGLNKGGNRDTPLNFLIGRFC